ncbi:MAG: ABC transporter ATP-binding protein [Candidatus Sumerlaeia bacterium]|nr:ABC transporter ATP-binding protein [Candidatus Sumerlaeia bacterium]
MIAVENLCKRFSGPSGIVQALDGVSLQVGEGEFVAVQGPSGCGKTTLLLIVGALLQPTEGRVCVGGANPYELPPDARARFRAQTIGFVFQQFHLVPYLTVRENILAPQLALSVPDAPQRADALLRRFQLADRARHTPDALSTGERQRTALARAFLNRPKVLLADEPTGNLDGDNAEIVLRGLADFAREGGAVLLVTHDVRAAQYASRILRMKDGRILSD